jgi:hypothetical protein
MRVVTTSVGKQVYKLGNHGTRDYMLLFYGALCQREYNNSQTIYNKMCELNELFKQVPDDHIDSRELQKIYKHLVRSDYTPSNAAMINYFKISSDEMQLLETIINKPEVKRRKSIRDSRYKASKAAERAKQKDSIKLQARSLHLTGLSYKEIAQSLNISVGTAFNYCK